MRREEATRLKAKLVPSTGADPTLALQKLRESIDVSAPVPMQPKAPPVGTLPPTTATGNAGERAIDTVA